MPELDHMFDGLRDSLRVVNGNVTEKSAGGTKVAENGSDSSRDEFSGRTPVEGRRHDGNPAHIALDQCAEEKFVRGYSVYPDGGCWEFPSYYDQIERFGTPFKREMKRRYPTPISMMTQIPTLPSANNYVDIDSRAIDSYGIPKPRIHFQWGENELKMWEHAKKTCAEILHAAGGILEYAADEPESPGYSQHEIGTARMGNDPKKFVTNRFGQTYDVPNLYIADASVFVNVTDKPPAFSILTFSLRTSEYIIQQFRTGRQ